MNNTISQQYLKYLTKNTSPAEGTSPIHKGEGIFFWDYLGRRYMDFSSQTLNLLLGQCHPKIVEALVHQIQTLTYASSRFNTLEYFQTAEKLIEVAPDSMTRVNIKMCDGSDANETGVKIARKYTGKTGIICFNNGHTGQTTQTIQLRGYGRDPRMLAGNSEDIVFVNPPKYKSPNDYKDTIKEIYNVVEEHGNIAAILIDPIMVNAGVLVEHETKSYLQKINDISREKNILLIIDENQSFGWVPDLFATKYFNIMPDIITMGKGLSAGYPLAGVLMKEKYKDVLDYNEADFTNGGHVLCCAAAYTTLSILQSTDFRIVEKEKLIKDKLKELKSNSCLNFTTRGIGLIHCIEIEENCNIQSDKVSESVYNKLLEKGLFLRKYKNKLVIKPPIVVTDSQIEDAFDILKEVFWGNI